LEMSWNQIVGGIYGQNLADPSISGVGNRLSRIWTDGSTDPKNGFVRAYGANNFKEDVATYVEAVYTNPGIFKDLINPKSPKYDEKYLKKLLLLKEYGFITSKEWKAITAR